MNNDYDELIDVIKSYTKIKSPFIAAKVNSVSPDNKTATVNIIGDNNTYNFYNKTGEVLSINDSVFILSFDGNLSNSIIAYRFGMPVWR